MSTATVFRAIQVLLAILLPSISSAQVADRLPEPPMSLAELIKADQIVYGTIKSVEHFGRPDLPQEAVLRVTLRTSGPESFLKGRPDTWPSDNIVTLDLALPTAVLLRTDDRVLWFLRNTAAGLETLGTTSGFFKVTSDPTLRYVARNLDWNYQLWDGPNALWAIQNSHGSFKKKVESQMRTILGRHADRNPANALDQETIDRMIILALERGSVSSPDRKLPLILLLGVIEAYYLNPTR
jgi:hypothetical protein